jgi:transposase
VVVLAASVQDRDGAKTTLLSMYLATPVRFVFADGGFAGKLVDRASRILATTLHIVRKPEGRQGFAVIPRRWAVERTFAWLTARRRLARG